MSDGERLSVKRGESRNTDAVQAVREFREQVAQPDPTGVLFFCSTSYDLPVLAKEMKKAFTCPVIGCTTAGEISSNGFFENGLVGASLQSGELFLHNRLISNLDKQDANAVRTVGLDVRSKLKLANDFNHSTMFCLLLIDGLSMLEEQFAAMIYHSFGEIPLIGGSAGDQLKFEKTYVYHDGEFMPNAAVVTVFETTLPFAIKKAQHFEPTDKRLVITESDPHTRVVKEINGNPAAEEYAALIGHQVEELEPTVFSAYPVMLKIGGQYYIRSIQKRNPDNSLTFYCAIEDGLVLRIARPKNMVHELSAELNSMMEHQPDTKLIIGCDCILRRLEIQNKGMGKELAGVLKDYCYIGFSTYGEQYNSVHVNQTLTAVAIGG